MSGVQDGEALVAALWGTRARLAKNAMTNAVAHVLSGSYIEVRTLPAVRNGGYERCNRSYPPRQPRLSTFHGGCEGRTVHILHPCRKAASHGGAVTPRRRSCSRASSADRGSDGAPRAPPRHRSLDGAASCGSSPSRGEWWRWAPSQNPCPRACSPWPR